MATSNPRWPQISVVRWGWYSDWPIPFTRYWLVFDVGRSWEVGIGDFITH